ncbi:MAG: helix-turn-helix domain-containing protein [Clostridia bacterium]|nr:helix-turn-helix domain-containing protein [Clostridia bacterium]
MLIQFPGSSYGTIIHNARIAKKMSQQELGKAIGVHYKSIANWEAGKSSPDLACTARLCEALDLPVDSLFGIKPGFDVSPEEKAHLKTLRLLSASGRRAVRLMTQSLYEAEQAENQTADSYETEDTSVKLIRCEMMSGWLAAGPDTGTDEEITSEPVYLNASESIRQADCIIRVNGDSMKPDFCNGDYVLVQRLYSSSDLNYGEIGAFSIGNENYIKRYERDGLHSINPDFPVMKFSDDDSLRLIGRVTRRLDREKDLPSDADLAAFSAIHPELGELCNPL